MQNANFLDTDGRWYKVLLPDGVDANDKEVVAKGIPVGPPPLELGLPPDTAVRLHNELFNRGLFTVKDVTRDRQTLFGAVLAAFRVDTDVIVTAYVTYEKGS